MPSTTDNTGEEASKSLAAAMQGNKASQEGKDVDISDAGNPMPSVSPEDLPHCPRCQKGLLRPGVVWFGEALPVKTMSAVDKFVEKADIDLMIVIGTSAMVWPAAQYIEVARGRGARVAVINMDTQDGERNLTKRDWFFHGDAGTILPDILSPVIGNISALLKG